jgi:hypothetical protein
MPYAPAKFLDFGMTPELFNGFRKPAESKLAAMSNEGHMGFRTRLTPAFALILFYRWHDSAGN